MTVSSRFLVFLAVDTNLIYYETYFDPNEKHGKREQSVRIGPDRV